MRERESHLLVVECSGTARSGKGSIVNHLGKSREGIATDETGADYRALTKALLHEGVIERDMPKEVLALHMARLSLDCLSDIVAMRYDIVQQFGHASLYANDVNETVSMVGAVGDARKAVKAGFRQRVEAVRDSDQTGILVVDGRNLASVIETIPNTHIALRKFVSCSADEAGRRECTRQGIDPESIEGIAITEAIKRRNEDDATRSLDPVQPDTDALDYWADLGIFTQTFKHLTNTQFRGNFDKAIDEVLISQPEKYSYVLRVGAGALAAAHSRQIHFDTGMFREHYNDPYKAMLDATDLMFDEAIEAAQSPLSSILK